MGHSGKGSYALGKVFLKSAVLWHYSVRKLFTGSTIAALIL